MLNILNYFLLIIVVDANLLQTNNTNNGPVPAQKSCGEVSHLNNTYFQNPDYPLSSIGPKKCTLTIIRCNPNICQLRIDFLTMKLAQPNPDGHCDSDAFTVTGGASDIPTICGENINQHMYVDFNGNASIQLTVKLSGNTDLARIWSIKTTQIACDSPERAPTGCLMYYTELTGRVKSFNYGSTANTEVNRETGAIATREMANLNYGVCVSMAPNYCSIEWSRDSSDPYSFTVSSDTGGLGSDVVGIPEAEIQGTDCQTDYIVIPSPMVNGNPLLVDRFCGNGFVTKTSSSKPFVLTVITNDNEIGDAENRGFQLVYRQIPC